MQYRNSLVSFVLLSLLLAVNAYSAVELYDTRASSFVPAFIEYTLNCPASVTVEILPSDSGGTPTGPPVKTVTFTSQSKGFHLYTWLGDIDGGGVAPYGSYVPRITATATQAQWGPISGLYCNNDWDTEFVPRPLPTVPDTEGFFGIGINKNPNSSRYGRTYVAHKNQKDILMYGPAGDYLGVCNDTSIAWGASAPWDLAVADDGWVYVSDRSNMIVHCFNPDGDFVSTSPTIAPARGIYARTTPDARTHIFVSGGSNGIREIIVEPDHVTWTQPVTIYNTGGGDGWDAYGMWVSQNLQTIYQACNQGPNVGLTRWLRQPGGNYVKDTGWSSNVGACIDVDVNGLGDPTEFLWVTKMVAYGTGVRAIHKVGVATGNTYYPPNADYDIVTWALMCCADGVGNVAVTFGKNTPTWAQRYWGLFAEPGVTTAQKLLTPFIGPSDDGCPIIIPDSAVWTPNNTIAADNTDSASVSVKVQDLNGWESINRVTLDLTSLGYPIRDAVITPDPSDLTGRTAIATWSDIRAQVGTRCSTSYGQPPHHLAAAAYGQGCAFPSVDDSAVQAQVTGSTVIGHVGHTRVPGWNVQGAQICAVGGGIPGATDPHAAGPFTYYSAPSGSNGNATIELSAGTFQVTGQKTGFGSQTPVTITAPYGGGTLDLYLRPMTVAEVRATDGGTKVNMEAVCFAQPVGYNCQGQVEAYGLAARTDTQVLRDQWYVCDPNDPSKGMLCLITKPTEMFLPQWDCPTGVDMFGGSTYIGKRPAQGETIMITGMLDTPGGHETRVLVGDTDLEAGLAAGTITRTYLNRGDQGGYPGSPIIVPVTDVAHDGMAARSSNWGEYVQINEVTVIRIDPVGNDNPLGEPVPYALVADAQGNTCEIAIQTPETLNMTQWALPGYIPDVGCTYDIRGAGGRRYRNGNGCIRVRGLSDFTFGSDNCGGMDPAQDLGYVRSAEIDDYVKVTGIVTAKIGTSLWIESPDRNSGARVMSNPSYVTVGDNVLVTGSIAMSDGERVIQVNRAIVPISSGNDVPPPFDLRTREVGGAACLADPGVTTGRGALNVGLRVHVQGMVTARAPGGQWFYVWDGANRSDMPVSDGNPDGFIGVRIESTFACAPWTDWVDVTGVVSTDASIAPGIVAPTIIPTSVAKVTAFDTITTPPGSPFKAGWNLASIPAAPAGTGDGDEWTPKPWDGYMVLTPNQDPDELDGRIYRWENCTGGLDLWGIWNEVGAHGPFGGLLVGDGFWLGLDADMPVSYSSKRSALDQWIGVCEPGWMMLGHPKEWNTYLDEVKVHAGDRIVSMYDAILTEGWIDCAGYWWDETSQGLMDIGIPDCWASTDTLRPWHGYWLQVNRGDLALIVPDSPAAP